MLVENSIVIANFVKGLFVPLEFLTVAAIILMFFIMIYTAAMEKPKALYWEIPVGIYLLFAIWFFSTFSLK